MGTPGITDRDVIAVSKPRPLCESLEPRMLLSAIAWQQEPAAHGRVVIDAIRHDAGIARNGQEWGIIAASGAGNGQAVAVLPNSGSTYRSGQSIPLGERAPQRDFLINFLEAGTYYVWIRGRGDTRNDNSVHVGLNGQELASSDNIGDFATSWSWINSGDGKSRVTIVVAQPGVHTLNLWCDEDGAMVDNIVLTRDAGYTPSGVGPAPSGRFAAAEVSGTVWSDRNLNGQFDTGEAIGGVELYLDTNCNRVFDPGERTAISDSSGAYLFGGLRGGYFPVRVVHQGMGEFQTWPPPSLPVQVEAPAFVNAVTIDNHRQIVYYTANSAVQRYDLVTRQSLEPITIGNSIDAGLDVSIDGKYLLIGGRNAGSSHLTILDIDSGTTRTVVVGAGQVVDVVDAVAATSRGTALVALSTTRKVMEVDLETGAVTDRGTMPAGSSNGYYARRSADGSTIVFHSAFSNAPYIRFDVATSTMTGFTPTTDEFWPSVSLSRDGSLIALDQGENVEVRDRNWNLIKTLPALNDPRFSETADFMIGSDRRNYHLVTYDTRTWQLVDPGLDAGVFNWVTGASLFRTSNDAGLHLDVKVSNYVSFTGLDIQPFTGAPGARLREGVSATGVDVAIWRNMPISLLPESDTGVLGDGVTSRNNAAPGSRMRFHVDNVVSGARVDLYARSGTLLGSAIAGGLSVVIETNGTAALADGTYEVTAAMTIAGSPALAAARPFTLTIDTLAPAVTANALVTRSGQPQVTGTVNDPTATVQVTVNGMTRAAINQGTRWILPAGAFDAILPGDYDVTAVATDPAGNTEIDATSGELTVLAGFGVLRGTLWHDANADGVMDPGEGRLAGRTVFLDANNNGLLDPGETPTITDEQGRYEFTGLAPGIYTVAQQSVNGWRQLAPAGNAGHIVTLAEGRSILLDFQEYPPYSSTFYEWQEIRFSHPFVTSPIFQIIGSSHNDWPGSQTLQVGISPFMVDITRIGGGAFTLKNLKLGDGFWAYDRKLSNTFTGTRADGTTVVQALSGSAGPDKLTFFTLDDMTDVISIRVTGFDPFDQLDDVAIDLADIPGHVNLNFAFAHVTAAPLAVDLLAESDTGISDADNITRLNNSSAAARLRFRIAGTIPGANVVLFADGMPVGQAVAEADETIIELDGMTALADGTRQFTAKQTQPDLPQSDPSPAMAIVIDTVAPTLTVTPQTTFDRTPAVAGDANQSLGRARVSIGGTEYSAAVNGATWSLADNVIAPSLAYGVHDVSIIAEDAAGNIGSTTAPGVLTIIEPTGVISGTLYHDFDRDTAKDSNEPWLAGWTVYLDLDRDGQLGPDEPTSLTNAAGAYSFTALLPGRYRVAVVLQDRWLITGPGILAQGIGPTAAVSIADSPIDGTGDSFYVGADWLLRQINSPLSGPSVENRVIREFDALPFAGDELTNVQLAFTLSINNLGGQAGRPFDVYLYAADGIAAAADFARREISVGRVTLYSGPQTMTLNVTDAVRGLIAGGARWIGMVVDPAGTNIYPTGLETPVLTFTTATKGVYDYPLGDGQSIAGRNFALYQIPEFAVQSTTPAHGGFTSSSAGTVDLLFTTNLDPSSISAADATIDGLPATSVTFVNASTLRFSAGPLPDGTHRFEMLAGAVIDEFGRTNADPVVIEFTIDTIAPRVLFSSVQQDDILPGGATTFSFRFSEPMADKGLDKYDLRLLRSASIAGVSNPYLYPDAINYDPQAFTFTATFNGLLENGYRLTLLSDLKSFVDRAGNRLDGEVAVWPLGESGSGDGIAGGHFNVDFTVDPAGTRSVLPLRRVVPLGSGVLQSVGNIGYVSNAGDTDAWQAVVPPATRITLVANSSDAARRLSITLAGQTHTAPAPGGAVVVTLPAGSADELEFIVSGDGPGGFTIDLYAGAVVEVADSIPEAPVALDPSSAMELLGRYAARGRIRQATSTDVDYYTLDLTGRVGQRLDMAFGLDESPSGAIVELFGPDGTIVAISAPVPSAAGYDRAIQGLVIPQDGTYTVRLTLTGSRPLAGYTLVACAGSVIEAEGAEPRTLDGVQGVLGYLATRDFGRLFGADSPQGAFIHELDPATGASVGLVSLSILRSASGGAFDGQRLFVWNGMLEELDPTTGRRLASYYPGLGGVGSLGIYDGQVLLLDTYTRQIHVLNPDTRAIVRALQLPISSVSSALAGASGRGSFFVTGSNTSHPTDRPIYEIDAQTGELLNTFYDAPGAAGSIWSPNGLAFVNGQLYISSDRLTRIDLATGQAEVLSTTPYYGLAGDGAFDAPPDSDDHSITLQPNQTVVLDTATPLDGFNTLNPRIVVYGSDGERVASDDGSAADGRNASVTYRATIAGTYRIEVVAESGRGEYVLHTQVLDPVEVAGRHIFYNHSQLDGDDAAANADDDHAIAAGKAAMLPGQTPTPANSTSYSRGINGIMIDLANLPAGASVAAEDFEFGIGNADDWSLAPAPSSSTTRPGPSGTTRVTIIWPDNAIERQWLRVTVLSDASGGRLGLAEDDVFHFGNLPGDANGDGAIDGRDYFLADREFIEGRQADLACDFNSDGVIDGDDYFTLDAALTSHIPQPNWGPAADMTPSTAETAAEAAFVEPTEDHVALPFIIPAQRSLLMARATPLLAGADRREDSGVRHTLLDNADPLTRHPA